MQSERPEESEERVTCARGYRTPVPRPRSGTRRESRSRVQQELHRLDREQSDRGDVVMVGSSGGVTEIGGWMQVSTRCEGRDGWFVRECRAASDMNNEPWEGTGHEIALCGGWWW